MSQNTNEKFTGSLGIILAAVASAIGLGNIWKFPYITGVYGGSAFVIVYLLCVTLIGVPLLLSAFIIGRKSETDPVDAFKKLSPHTPWFLNGWLAIFTSLAIISFYSVVAGWAIYYAYLSATGGLVGLSPEEIGKAFGTFTSSSWQPLIWQLIFMIATSYIVIKDVRDGIERYSRLLMPLLLVLLISLDIRAVTLDGASVGLDFLFKPDFSKLTVEAVLSALGHSFFTLSIGAGYNDYLRRIYQKEGQPSPNSCSDCSCRYSHSHFGWYCNLPSSLRLRCRTDLRSRTGIHYPPKCLQPDAVRSIILIRLLPTPLYCSAHLSYLACRTKCLLPHIRTRLEAQKSHNLCITNNNSHRSNTITG